MDDHEIYQRAKRRVGQLRGFYVHATVYVLVNALLITINLLASRDHIWFFYPLLGWGIGLLAWAFGVRARRFFGIGVGRAQDQGNHR
jgi:hypothetical protein